MDPGPFVLVVVGLLLVVIFVLLSEGRYLGGGVYQWLRRRFTPPAEDDPQDG